jgi:cytochrome c
LRNSGIVRTEETLASFIEDPEAHEPGGTMAYPGVKDEAERTAVVKYLLAKTGSGGKESSGPSDQRKDAAGLE